MNQRFKKAFFLFLMLSCWNRSTCSEGFIEGASSSPPRLTKLPWKHCLIQTVEKTLTLVHISEKKFCWPSPVHNIPFYFCLNVMPSCAKYKREECARSGRERGRWNKVLNFEYCPFWGRILLFSSFPFSPQVLLFSGSYIHSNQWKHEEVLSKSLIKSLYSQVTRIVI